MLIFLTIYCKNKISYNILMSRSKNNDFLYDEPEDSDLPYNIYKKREYYYNRVPDRPIMKNYQ